MKKSAFAPAFLLAATLSLLPQDAEAQTRRGREIGPTPWKPSLAQDTTIQSQHTVRGCTQDGYRVDMTFFFSTNAPGADKTRKRLPKTTEDRVRPYLDRLWKELSSGRTSSFLKAAARKEFTPEKDMFVPSYDSAAKPIALTIEKFPGNPAIRHYDLHPPVQGC